MKYTNNTILKDTDDGTLYRVCEERYQHHQYGYACTIGVNEPAWGDKLYLVRYDQLDSGQIVVWDYGFSDTLEGL